MAKRKRGQAAKAAEKEEVSDKSEGAATQDTAAPTAGQKGKRSKGSKKKGDKGFIALPSKGPSKVIYVGRVPHGFYEEQMTGFFSQFGKVEKVRLSRSKTTGRSKHFAFIKFDSAKVAATVAKVMNGYHLFDHVLVSHIVAPKDIHPSMFKGANKKFRPVPWQLIARKHHNRERTPEERSKAITRLGKKEQRKREKLKALGIDYDFKGYVTAKAEDASPSGDEVASKAVVETSNKKSKKSAAKGKGGAKRKKGAKKSTKKKGGASKGASAKKKKSMQ